MKLIGDGMKEITIDVQHPSLERSIEAFANTVNSIQTGKYKSRNVTKTENGKQRPLTEAELLQDERETAKRHLEFMQKCVNWIGNEKREESGN